MLLALMVMTNLGVPLSVSAEEEPATGNDIYAILYDIRSNDNSDHWRGYELVFQKGSAHDQDTASPRRKYVKTYSYSEFGTSILDETDINVIKTRAPWYKDTPAALGIATNRGAASNQLSTLISKISIKDKIKPESMAGWFQNCSSVTEIENLENIDTSICTDMAFTFYEMYRIQKLDLHTFDTSNVERIDRFIYSCGDLEEVNVSGFDLRKVKSLTEFIHAGWYNSTTKVWTMGKLNKVNLSGIDLSEVQKIDRLISYTGALEELDISDVNLQSAYSINNLFLHNRGLKKLKFGKCEIGKKLFPSTQVEGGYAYELNHDDYLVNGSTNDVTTITFNSMFEGCVALEEVDFGQLTIDFGGYAKNTTLEYYNVKNSTKTNTYLGAQYYRMFKDCESLTTIKNLGNIFDIYTTVWSTWVFRETFTNCPKLEALDMSNLKRSLTYSPSIFKGCSSLKTLDLSGLGLNMSDSERTRKAVDPNRLASEKDIYEGCEELSEVVFSPYYPRKYEQGTGGYTGSSDNVPAEKNWVKIENPDPADYPGYPTNYSSADPEYKDGNAAYEGYCDIGTKLTSAELFGDFKPKYAGRWVVVSQIALRANGGTPETQYFDGARGMAVSYNENDIVEPKRNGYRFDDWYSEKADGEGEKLVNDGVTTAKSWSYYAHWIENKYNLELYGNGGITVKNNEEVDHFTVKENLPYSQYFELSNTMFSRDGYILTGWNTRPNGSGDAYAANDSVNKLVEKDGETAKLYAQWHKPDFVLSFDANYDGAESVPNKNYTFEEGKTTLYGSLAEITRSGYTFMGWYTASTGGTKITETTELDPQLLTDNTLYAQWRENPSITFDANGGHFETKQGTTTTYIKQYNYNRSLGVIPTPIYSSAVLKGWYTKNGSGGDWGNDITSAEENGGTAISSPSDKNATVTATYYARWGYCPEFESNGGVYATYPTYAVQDSSQYEIASAAYKAANPDSSIPVLPTFTDDTDFAGWYFGNTNLTEYLKTNDKITLDLSQGKTIEARWNTRDVHKVTLNLDGGTLKTGYRNPVQVYDGNTVEELPVPTKTVDGVEYEFLGWYTAADGGEKKDFTFKPVDDCNLYAHWAAKTCTVTFDPNGGEMYLPDSGQTYATTKVYSGGTVTALPGANRNTYSLVGWYPEADGTGEALTTSTAITGNTTYYAKWISNEDQYTVSEDGLYKYAVKWETPSNEYLTNIGDDIIIAPANGNSALSARLFIRFNFSKSEATLQGKSLPVGSVKIKVPKYVFADKNGNKVGSNNINNGFSKTDTPNCHFIYDDQSDPDYYIITNNEVIDRDSQYADQAFQLDYTLSPSELRNMNGGSVDENSYYGGGYYDREINGDNDSDPDNDPVKVTIQVDRELDGANETDFTKNLGLEVHTRVKADTSKTRASVSFGWNSEWGEEPADADQYYYVIWELTASFDNSNSQKFKYSWSEDTVHDGSIVKIDYPSGYSESNYYTSGTFKTKVITKHPRKTTDSGWKTVYNEAVLNVDWLSGYSQQIRVSKEDGVYLIPDGTIRVFEKRIEGYDDSTENRIKSGAPETILGRTSYTDLPFEIHYQEYKNTDSNVTWYPNTKTYTAPERSIQISDGAYGAGDVVMSTVKGASRYNWENDGNVVLSDVDYNFDNIQIYITEFDAVQVNGEWSEPYDHTAFRDYDDVEIWTRAETETDFRLYRRLSASDFRAPDTSMGEYTDKGAAVADVYLPEKTCGFKVVHKSSFYATKLLVCPNLCLNSSNKVFAYVRDNVLSGDNTMIKNKASLDVDGAQRDSRRMDSGGATVCSYELKPDESYIYANKICASNSKYFTVDNEAGTQEFPVLISGWGANRAGSIKLIESGVFYDLLPYNFTVDKSTVFVKRRQPSQTTSSPHAHSYDSESKSNTFPSSLYTVDFIENWQGSGRTMMKVTITGVPEKYKTSINGFNVFYKMKTTMANVVANGTTQMNYTSFTDTTENQTVPVSRFSALSSFDAKISPYYKSIEDSNSEFTAYASNSTSCQTPVQFATGFNCSVKTEGNFLLGEKTVGLDSGYTYNISFTDGEREASELVIYDVIENSLTGASYEWKGEFQSVDVSAIANMEDKRSTANSPVYCKPKVYYCVTDNSLTKADLDITKDIWTDVEPTGADKLRVKAVAIDCRTASDGNAFVLPGKKALSFNISMKSPEDNEKNDVITYNEAFVTGYMDNEPISSETLIRVMLHYATPQLSKTSFPASGEDADHRAGAAMDSTIEYSLTVKNPDDLVPIRNIVVEDLLDAKLKINSSPRVQVGSESPVSIGDTSVTYSILPQNGRDNFVATIPRLEAGETMTIIIPATITDAEEGYRIDNTAAITSANGESTNIESETTYHVVTLIQAKIRKLKVNGEGLAGATLEIYDNTSQNFDSSTGKIKAGATPKTIKIGGSEVTSFTSAADAVVFNLDPGDYVLHEVSTPDNTMYKTAEDIPFSIDVEGIQHVGGKKVSYVEMVDEPVYKIVFHENKPSGTAEEKAKEFKTYGPGDIKNSGYKIAHFYDIPEWAGDEYVFAGWFYKTGFAASDNFDAEGTVSPLDFENQTYPRSDENDPQDYHLYAKWIAVGTVSKAEEDANVYGDEPIRGFGLAGVQIREEKAYDPNIRYDGGDDSQYNNSSKLVPGGMRFVTSLSEKLITDIKGISKVSTASSEAKGFGVEYGYAVGTEANINTFTGHYNVKDLTKYKLQYKGGNVNGVNTDPAKGSGTADTDFRYITNVNCTSRQKATANNGIVKLDHRNFDAYRLYTLVVTYDENTQDRKGDKIDARAYIRYYDANGKLRVFYNDYKKNMYYGGCLCSYDLLKSMSGS